jgi:simple sugar transport system permease protein
MSEILTTTFLISVLTAAVRAGTPLFFAALGEILTERSGVLNLGLEGLMILGALSGFWMGSVTGNPWLGVLAAMISAGLLSLLHAFLCIHLRGNQVISGIMLVLLGMGLSSFLGENLVGKTTQGFQPIPIPILSRLPILGPVLFQHNILVYLAMGLAFLSWFFLFKTRWGLEVIAVGESPEAADTVGVPVQAIRYVCVLVGGMLAGIGGAFLSLAYTRMWVDQMTAGRGWIAIALVIFSAWLPQRALLGAYFFGGIEGLQLRLQAAGIGLSYHILQMMPYLATIFVLIFSARREFRQKIGAPAALMKPYVRGERA